MKNIDLSGMGMRSLSADEAESITGGSFWSRLRDIHHSILAVAQFVLVEPLQALGREFGNGFEKGSKR